jgi:hypothetical protein
MSEQTFRSPVSKLLPFFHGSRDKWKAKCKRAKKEVKSLKTRMAKLKASRDHWKQKACQSAEAGTAPERTEASAIKNPAPRVARSGRSSRSLSAARGAGGR